MKRKIGGIGDAMWNYVSARKALERAKQAISDTADDGHTDEECESYAMDEVRAVVEAEEALEDAIHKLIPRREPHEQELLKGRLL